MWKLIAMIAGAFLIGGSAGYAVGKGRKKREEKKEK